MNKIKYTPYPKYKNSGVEWLGGIPVGWGNSKHKYTASFQKGQNPDILLDEKETGTVKYLSMDFLRGNSRPLFAKVDKNNCLATEGQVLIIWDGSNAGEFVKAKDGLVSSTMASSELISDLDKNYYWYICVCLEPEMRKHAIGMGIPHVNGNELKNSIIPTPPIDEQGTIAAFLDHETGKIDELICKQQNLIALLEEKRQAVISHAVTKGLDPNVPMKDSGVEWLGEVPGHWEVKRIKNIVSAIIDGPHFSPKYQESGYMFISARNIKVNQWSLDDAKFISESDYNQFNNRVKPEVGDVLLTKGGTTGVARVVDLDFPFQVWVHVAVLKVIHSEVNSNYLSFSLNVTACYEQSQLYTRGATNNDLGLSRIANIFIASPPQKEQKLIVSFLKVQCKKIDALISKAKSAIELMQERRTALISAAVTGKIDVRNFEPNEHLTKGH